MNKTLEKLLKNNPALWRAGDISGSGRKGVSTGYAELDAVLPNQGWPEGALIEVIVPHWGVGELQLLLPALVAVSRQPRSILWIAPPFVPYAPGLAAKNVALDQVLVLPAEQVRDAGLWVMEKVLRAQRCGIAMSWPARLTDRAGRRLQLAAEAGRSMGFVFRSVEAKSSPAALRLRLKAIDQGLQVDVLKARGGGRFKQVCLNISVG